jgi:hypothetical protein
MTSVLINFENLSLDSTLEELPSYDCSIDQHMLGKDLDGLFSEDHQLPGVLIMDREKLTGIISRDTFYEIIGKQFGTEIYLRRPITVMLDRISHQPLILPADCKISIAVNEAFKRPQESIYEPLILQLNDGGYRLVGILLLFMAQSQLLINYHNQSLFDLMAGLKMSDDVAIEKFIQFAALPPTTDRKKLQAHYSIVCMQCRKKVPYSIADIVRSHQQLNTGIEIRNRMGIRSYLFYLRHQCGTQLVEIPVQHDAEFAFSSLRLPRPVGSYL